MRDCTATIRTKTLWLAATLLLMSPALSTAADVKLSYTVDDKVLKDAVSATNLTFQLYTDAGCTALTLPSKWVDALCDPILDGAQLKFPKSVWALRDGCGTGGARASGRPRSRSDRA